MRIAGLIVLLAGAVLRAQTPEWPGWDEYQTIVWSTGAPRDFKQWVERLRQIHFTAEQCTIGNDPSPYVSAGFGFYVENLVAELGFLNTRKPIYDADYQGYVATRDKKYLLRKPSLHDEEAWMAVEARLRSRTPMYAGKRALAYNLRDELSIGSFVSPMDYCYSPQTLAAFREWLKGVYGSLEALNAQWETGFESWDEVTPLTTYETKDRERAALAAGAPENYSSWNDHRAFMDLSFNSLLDRLRRVVHERDASAPVGVEGTQMPSAWGGFDLWRMSRVVDWIEPYDIASSRKVLRSFLPEGTPVLSTLFGDDFPRLRRNLWRLLLQGDRGVIVWDDAASRIIEKDQEELPLTARGKGLAPILAEIRDAAKIVFPLRRRPPRIAIHYSQASIRAHWMFDSREDRDTWPRRLASYEASFSRFARVRDSFQRVIEDLGLEYNFVSYEQLERQELARGAYTVLILPQSVAMSEAECREVEEFVLAGGLVIADNMVATMDEHCRRRPKGRLDSLFGIERKTLGWRAKAAGPMLPPVDERFQALQAFDPDLSVTDGTPRATPGGTPVIVEKRSGEGRAVYLNIGMHEYGKWRLKPPSGANLTALFKTLLQEHGMEPEVRVLDPESGSPVAAVEVLRYDGPDGEYVALMRNPEPNATGSLKQAGYPDNAALESDVAVKVVFPREADLTEMISGESREAAREWIGTLEPWRPLLFRLR
ncbi:MAG: beta-galactosidase trimerization domain-containing protein [Bryobacteraceae bacterium]